MTKLELFKKQIPLLMVYFVTGFASFTAVTFTFLKRDFFELSALEWSSIAIWAGFPWSVKIIYAAFIDEVPLFKSHRKSYLILGAGLFLVGNTVLLDILHFKLLDIPHMLYLSLGAFIMASGTVVMDIVADTLGVDIVENTGDMDLYRENLGRVGVNSRLALMVGSILAALVTGHVAQIFTPVQVYTMAVIPPILVMLVALFFDVKEPLRSKGDLTTLKSAAVFFGLSLCLILFLGVSDSQIPLFFTTLAYILYLSKGFLADIDPKVRKTFVLSAIAVFCFRIIPSPSEPVEWWIIGSLGFDELFFGRLRIIATVTGFLALLVAKKWISRANVAAVLIIFTLVDLVLNFPTILAYYGFGNPAYLLIAETAMSAPLANLAMIPLHILLAQFAPVNKRAIYIAVTAAFVNLALTAGDLFTKMLNGLYVVTQDDFSQLGSLLWASMAVSLFFSVVGILLVRGRK